MRQIISKTPKTCVQCGGAFTVTCRRQFENQKCCSQTCMAKWQTGREWRKTDAAPAAKKCEMCDIDFIGRTPRARFCSSKCSVLAAVRKRIAKHSDLASHIGRLLKMSGYSREGLSVEFILSLYEKQGGRCALTGLEMTWKTLAGRVQTNLSIDRISSLCGYTPDNIQLVCRMANVMKGELSQSDFIAVCRRIVENSGAK